MNLHLDTTLSGRILSLEVRDKHGRVKVRQENIPNIVMIQSTWTDAQMGLPSNTHRTFTSSAESWEDLPGTWSQSGNTITRASGSGTFPSSPSQIANELYWYDAGGDTGHRCHVTARASDTSITVSGAAKTITGGKIRRFIVNGSGVSDSTGSQQSSSSATQASSVYNDTAGTRTVVYDVSFPSAVSAYTLRSIIPQSFSRIVLPAPIAIEVDDQLQYTYEVTETVSGRFQQYDLGVEAVGIPQKHSMTSIVGNGSYVDVTFSGATHFAAGDKLDLRNVVCLRKAITSINSDGTKWTFVVTGHGRSVSDSIIVENAAVGGYNGTWTISNVVDANTFEVADVSTPGASGAAGTVRLATPGTYFDDLGLATIASMQSGNTVARITSTTTGPAADPMSIGGDPGVTVVLKRKTAVTGWRLITAASACYAFTEANAKAVADHTTTGSISTSGSSWTFTSLTETSASHTNDWTHSYLIEKSAGVGTGITRCKQLLLTSNSFGGNETQVQITFNTPFTKTEAERLRITISKQLKRTLTLPA